MKKKLHWITIGFIVLVIVPALSGFASPIVKFTETPESGGYNYQFALWGTIPTDNLFELFLDIPLNVSHVSQVVAPIGWGSVTDPSLPGVLSFGDNGSGRFFIDAIADVGYELIGVASLNGFGFNSTTRINEAILFSWNYDLENLGRASMQDGPSPIPEPTTIILFGLGLLGLAGVSRKQK